MDEDITEDQIDRLLQSCRSSGLGPDLDLEGLWQGIREGGGLGRYRDLRWIDGGGMGSIYEATDPEFGRKVALKVIRHDRAARLSARERFLSEARITGQLEHPNIVPVYEMVTSASPTPYFVMRRVDGDSLHDRLASLARGAPGFEEYPLTRRLNDFLKVCDAVAFAHDRGVLHRDLKPRNIMLGDHGEVFVLDWGIARTQAMAVDPADRPPGGRGIDPPRRALTGEGIVLGTYPYIAPEQVRADGDAISAATDIYSLGATLHEWLTLEPPFEGAKGEDLNRKILTGDLALAVPLPKDLEAVIVRAMALEPADRYRSVLDMKGDIEAFLEGRPLSAAEYGLLEVVRRWIGRHRLALSMTILLLASATGVSAFFAWQDRVQRERRFDEAMAEAGAASKGLATSEELRRLRGGSSLIDPRTGLEYRESPRERHLREEALAGYRKEARALERALELHPGDSQVTARRVAVGIELGRIAILGPDFTLARASFEELTSFGLGPAEVAAYLDEVDDASKEILTWRARRLEEILDGTDVVDHVVEAAGFRDQQTLAILERQVERWEAASGEEHGAWTERIIFICRVLGALDMEGCVEALGRVAHGVDERMPEIAAEVGLALCRTGLVEAWPALQHLVTQFGNRSATWKRIEGSLHRIPTPSEADEAVTPEDHFNRGIHHLMHGASERALESFTRSIELDPGPSPTYYCRSTAYIRLGRYSEAIEDLTTALEHARPGDQVSRYVSQRSYAHLASGEYEAALADNDAVVTAGFRLAETLLLRGKILCFLGRTEEGIACLDESLARNPTDPQAYLQRGIVLSLEGDQDRALADLTRAIELGLDDPESRQARGIARVRHGSWRQALLDLERAQEMAPGDPEPHYWKGRAYVGLRQWDLAIAEFDSIIDIGSRSPARRAATHYHRASAFLGRGDPGRALADAGAAASLEPGNWLYWREYGLLLLRTGDRQRGLESLRRALELAPPEARPAIEERLEQR